MPLYDFATKLLASDFMAFSFCILYLVKSFFFLMKMSRLGPVHILQAHCSLLCVS